MNIRGKFLLSPFGITKYCKIEAKNSTEISQHWNNTIRYFEISVRQRELKSKEV